MRDILNLKGCKKIAIMGGTFDPIHYGHLVTAEAVRHEYGIERVIFIPTGKPPHKADTEVTHSEHRYLMTVLATVTNPCFDVSRIEIDRPGYTYTIDTLTELKKLCGSKTQIYFITGADAVHQMLGWKDPDKLFGLCNIVAVSRPGYNKKKLLNRIADISKKFEVKLSFLEVPALSISSSDIRQRVRNSQPIKYLLPEEVEEYIYKFGLYNDSEEHDDLTDNLDGIIKDKLSKKRYAHTVSVANEAVKLAKVYGEDPKKTYIAAMLHDYAKELSDSEKERLCQEYGIALDEVMIKQLDLVHSFLSAEIAEREYHISDADVLNAIRYHTTGRRDMSRLEKIIFIADAIEPKREQYPGLDRIRKTAYKDLDRAVYESLKATIEYNKEKGREIHPLGYEALEFINQNLLK